jgi:predicted RNA binding protein YcfA (HicA-like mRNA interferase family)
MSKIPQISGREAAKALQKIGFVIKRQKGSHMTLIRDDPYKRVVIPAHKTLKMGMLRDIIRKAGLTVDEFLALLKD